MVKKRYTYSIGERGKPLGEAHYRAKISDRDVDLIRDIYEEGLASYSTLAAVFNTSKENIRDIITFRRRCATPTGYKTVETFKRAVPKDRLLQLGFDRETLELDDDEWDSNH